jgi:peptidoglycan hydrolase-like protein with peptidoglycan-binding domain
VVQAVVNAKLGSRLAVDGQYGKKTTAAVKRFQKAAGITADGIVGPQTWAALNATPDK